MERELRFGIALQAVKFSGSLELLDGAIPLISGELFGFFRARGGCVREWVPLGCGLLGILVGRSDELEYLAGTGSYACA